jgi:DMSO/TMAO reductase YedYZ molybdopterin-dependent catalytic subunit
VRGQVNQTLSLSLNEILQGLPRVEIAAVNQCAGASRIYAVPRVAGAQWANGSMSNAIWTGVRLKDVLDRAGVKPSAIQVRFGGLDAPIIPDAPKLLKSLTIDHARDGEVMIAFVMNGEQLPLLNGFPLRLVVPRGDRQRVDGLVRNYVVPIVALPVAVAILIFTRCRCGRVSR